MNSFVGRVVRLLRRVTGLTSRQLTLPYAWLPYHLYHNGSAWRPLSVTLELTYLCNLRCQMCALVQGDLVTRAGQRRNLELRQPDGSLKREISTDEYLDIIRQIGRAGVRKVTLTGGEPTLRRDITTLVAAIKAYPIQLSLISNGLGKPDLYRELIRLGLDSLTISVDGPRAVHDHVRGLEGSFDRTMAAVQAVIAERKAQNPRRPWLAVSCAVSALNQDEIENLVRWFQDYDIDNLSFGYLHFSTPDRQRATEGRVEGPLRHLKDHELPDRIRDVDPTALAATVARIKAERQRLAVPVSFSPDLNADEIRRQYTDETFTFANQCFEPWLSTRIDPWGQMYPCWIDIRLGDVREHGFLKLWNSQLYRKFRQTIREKKLLAKCSTCPALSDKTWSKIPTLKRGFLRAPAPCAKNAGS